MRWKGRQQSDNVEDKRGMSAGGIAAGGGIGIALLALVVYLLGGDPSSLPVNQGAQQSSEPYQPTAEEKELTEFISVVLKDTEDVWTAEFQRLGTTYQKPKLVLFSGQVQSACGFASAAVGPFYCPEDHKLYIDLSFYNTLKERFGAPGDFAQAYVIAHEVGHHIQNLLGTMAEVQGQRGRISDEQYNQLSVRLELQADFYAGVWARKAHELKSILDAEDIDEALRAAAAIGDDTLQKQSQGYTVPESFTHGTSEQRMRWFKRGWDTGDVRQGDTFSVRNL
jgi:predicted metalloprotease